MNIVRSNDVHNSPDDGVIVDWLALVALPFDEWERAPESSDLRQWVHKVSNMTWSSDDEHFIQPKYTTSIMRLLRLISRACSDDLRRLRKKNEDLERSAKAAQDAEESMRARVELLRRENNDFRIKLEQKETEKTEKEELNKPNIRKSALSEIRDSKVTKEELEKATRELVRLRHENNELRQSLQFRDADKIRVVREEEKFQLEYKHLVARHKRLIEKSRSTEQMLEELQRSEKIKKENEETELHRLRQKVRILQQENYDLIQSRDHAEELCERREAEALRDMTELQQLHRDIIDEERQRFQSLNEELQRVKREADRNIEESVRGLQQMLRQSEEENSHLRKQLERHSTTLIPEDESTEGSDTPRRASLTNTGILSIPSKSPNPSRIESDNHTIQKLVLERQRLQQENDRLSAELQQMEVRAEARDLENNKVHRLLKEYERGDEGLRRLRNELVEFGRSNELLQEENSQLRERLNAMEDSLTFSSALQELCIRIGVTQEEIDRLRPKGTRLLSEVETLREEVNTLKSEVEWLEKERRHWMDKVRLQPLLDTKLRLELGLSSEQLKQLDYLVDQMKSGRLIVEENEENYKEKYFHELQLRRKEMEHFNDFVRQRIEEALREVLGKTDLTSAPEATSALQFLKERVDLITTRPILDTPQETNTYTDTGHLREQLRSALQLLEQSELTIKDNTASQATLREQLAAVTAERDVLMNERDKYRNAVFEALGVNLSPTLADERQLQDAAEMSSSPVSTEIIPLPFSQTTKTDINAPLRSGTFFSISRTFEEQLRVKDELIASLKNAINISKEEISQYRAEEVKVTQQLAEASAIQEDLKNQVSVFQQMNEELNEKLVEQSKMLEDVQDAMQRVDSGNTRELLQKIVILRQREGKLLQRLRRVMETQEEASRSEQTMREYVNTTFQSLKDALENKSTGFVLPRSSGSTCMENEVIKDMQQRIEGALRGKIFKEDSAYLLQLQQIYRNMDQTTELNSLRNDLNNRKKEINEMENELGELRIEVERLRKLNGSVSSDNTNKISQSTRLETEVTTWKQKCNLYIKRCEDKEREVSTLEAELGDARREIAFLEEHLHNFMESKEFSTNNTILAVKDVPEKQQQEEQEEKKLVSEEKVTGDKTRHMERDIARLKSINLGLLHHSLDLQGECKRLEIQLEATKQELSLVRDTGDSQKVSEFVSAAIRQHAALRQQTELALLRAKRFKMQLLATEANLRVAVNEATAYKLSAFRLYQKYVEQMISLLDYIRSVQRDIEGSMTPHRVSIIHKRLMETIADVESGQIRQNELAAQLAESNAMVTLLQQQLELLKTKDAEEHSDALHAKLLSSLSAVREKDVRLAELQEDYRYMQQKLKRSETHTQQLMEELSRLELRATCATSIDGDVLQKLLQLKETVFSRVESPAVIIQPTGPHSRDINDTEADAAIREYKEALDKQAELARECASLKKRLNDEVIESRKSQSVVDTLKEEINRLQERLHYAQQRLEEERHKSQEREQRIIRSHEAQAEVTRRAAEHNSQSLIEMLRNKDSSINHLQEQLQAERRKYLEYQVEESTRMERLHEHLFKENNAMVERFREAIDGVAENNFYTNPTLGTNTISVLPDSATDQLALLTKETLRLKTELKDARATNILLESQLNEQITKAQQQLLVSQQNNQHVQNVGKANEASVFNVINDQNAIIESLRQREFSLTRDLQREKNEKELLEQQLHEVRNLVVEQGGVLKNVASTGVTVPSTMGSAIEQELRAQLSLVESQLSETRVQLLEAQQNAQRLEADTSQWRAHFDALREEVVSQQADVERARRLVVMNDNLNADIQRMGEQNEKLIMATNMLKQKLIEETQQRGNASRKQQHELALAQRMGSIQQESTEQLKVMNDRLRSIQRELEEKVHREEEALKKHEEAQRMAYELHRQLQDRESEILRLRRELAATRSLSSENIKGAREKGTQVLQTIKEEINQSTENKEEKNKNLSNSPKKQVNSKSQEVKQQEIQQHKPHSISSVPHNRSLISDIDANALVQPQIAAILRREIEKAQRDNLHEISSLRASLRRLEIDLEESRVQLRGEREVSKSLRIQIQNLQKELESKEITIAREEVNRNKREEEQKKVDSNIDKPSNSVPTFTPSSLTARPSSSPMAVEFSVQGRIQLKRENEQLKLDIERLKKRLTMVDEITKEAERYKKELAEVRCRQMETVDASYAASPLDIRSHKRTVLHLENVIESLQRELNISKETQVRNLQRRIDDLVAENQRLISELSRYQVVPTPISNITPSRVENMSDRSTLERELLEKNSTILDLRFEQEVLQLKVRRLERHIEDILKVDSTNTKRLSTFKHRGRVEALESVVDNLKLVVERLQNENSLLKSKTVSMSKHMDLVRELRELRAKEKKLREHSEKLTKRLLGSATGGSVMSEQQARLQRRLQTAHATVEQYQTEVLELKQRLDERQQFDVDNDPIVSMHDNENDSCRFGDRRAVQPLDSSSTDLPPPLPSAPLISNA